MNRGRRGEEAQEVVKKIKREKWREGAKEREMIKAKMAREEKADEKYGEQRRTA